jgi:thiamine biosynthesis lipoprotein
VHRVEEVMGTVVTIDGYLADGSRRGEFEQLVQSAVDELHHIDQLLSTWLPESAISRVRRDELSLADSPEELREVLEDCVLARELTRGWFDPWALTGGVDPTGYVKGWAAQRAISYLKADWVGGAIVNAAGDVAVIGSPAPGEVFRVGIVDPWDPGRVALIAAVDAALATSGTYERGEHLFNPITNEWRSAVASASVTGPLLGMADAFATALAVGGIELLDAIGATGEYEGLVIDYSGNIACTEGFPFSTEQLLRK